MTLVVDASVALKWVLPEPGADAAERLLTAEPLVAPDFMWLECANVLAMTERRELIAPDDARRAMGVLDRVPVRRIPIRPHIARTHALATELRQSAYDCLYLAVALAEDAIVVTADARFAAAVQANPAYAARVQTL